MSTLTQFLGGKPRRQIVTLTASNAALAIPVWAQGGKGIVYVTGCGGGASGLVSATTGTRGPGGGAGGYAMRHPMLIPSGTTTLNATIGAGGAAVSAAASADGNNGGSTTLVVGSSTLRLEGGRGVAGTAAGSQGLAYIGAVLAITPTPDLYPGPMGGVSHGGGTPRFGARPYSGLSDCPTLRAGGHTYDSGIGGHYGAGGHSPFGEGGIGLVAGPSVNTGGADATGYGAGGAGALWLSGGTVTSGAGSPGLLILEFVEGV